MRKEDSQDLNTKYKSKSGFRNIYTEPGTVEMKEKNMTIFLVGLSKRKVLRLMGFILAVLTIPSTLQLFRTLTEHKGTNTALVFAGRWEFLRINFPYFYRDLKENGGVIDRVWYMMNNYDENTQRKLQKVVNEANKHIGRKAFVLNYMGHTPGDPPKDFPLSYNQPFDELSKDPSHRYFKMDDDIVYIHPGTFESMLESKKDCAGKCFVHFGNIVLNWRSTITHQRMGLFNNSFTNPNSLVFDYDPYARCGWESLECAEILLKTFLHNYKQKSLHRYLFDGCEQLSDRRRYSINFFMIDKDTINLQALAQSPPLEDDELWWSETYPNHRSNEAPNCIIGKGLVVHFSYFTTHEELKHKGYLQKFEMISRKELNRIVPDQIWDLLEE